MKLSVKRSLTSLTLLFLLLLMTATIGTGLTGYFAMQSTIEQLVDKRIRFQSLSLAHDGEAVSAAIVAARISAELQDRDSADMGMILQDREGLTLAGNIALSRPLPLGFSDIGSSDAIKGMSSGRALVREISGGLQLTVIGETDPIDNFGAVRLRTYVLGYGSVALIVIAGLVVFSRTVSRRTADIRRTADAIVDGDMTSRVPTAGLGGEFGQQARAFNRMLDRISELMAGISNVSNDIAHDLRTPLARLRNRLVALTRDAEAGDADLMQGLEEAVAQTDHILGMFAAILRIAEVQGGKRRAGFARLDLAALATEVGLTMEAVAAETGHGLETTGCERPVWVTGDRQLLSQALINLVENALRYTPAGSLIVLEVARRRGGVQVAVADNGPGIPADSRALALRRFGRLDKSRASGGYGLGLPLVDAVAQLHRGTLTLEDAGPGLRAVIALPDPRTED